jgi:hypothetical protein
MKKYFNNIQSVVIVGLILVILLLRNCSGNRPQPQTPEIVRDTTIEYVTIEKTTPVYIPKVKYITKVNIDTFQAPIDTSAILSDYFAEKYYDDEQDLDSLTLVIMDTISQNSIIGRQIHYTLKYPKTTITEKIYLNKREFYVGVGMAGNVDQINYFGGEAVYKNKKRQAFGLGVGVNQDLVPIISARMYWKLGR